MRIQLERGDIGGTYIIRLIDKEKRASTRLIQTDFDYPGLASSFGWSPFLVQKCPACDDTWGNFKLREVRRTGGLKCESCRVLRFDSCDHDGTDGTKDCDFCGLTASQFIQAAEEYLDQNEGKRVADPGYF